MNKFKINLLYNEEEFFCTKTELLNLKITSTLAKLDVVDSRIVLNGLIFSDNIPVGIQLVTFLLLSNKVKLALGQKLKDSDNHRHL